jgi:hypothetical protein
VSAIVAAKGAIRARNADVSYAIAAILALGAVGSSRCHRWGT